MSTNAELSPNVELSPPQYTLWNQINSALGNAPTVKVGPLNTSTNPNIVPITISDHNQAVAMASIMTLTFKVTAHLNVDVQIKDGDGNIVTPIMPTSPDQLAGFVKTALGDNGWFVDVQVGKPNPMAKTIVWPVFAKAVIQFPNDDQTDLYKNYNNAAGLVFKNILNPAPGGIFLYSSTARS